jgi:hypothetical protein
VLEVRIVNGEIGPEVSAVLDLMTPRQYIRANGTRLKDSLTGEMSDTRPYTASEEISGLGETTKRDSPDNTNSHNSVNLFNMDLTSHSH